MAFRPPVAADDPPPRDVVTAFARTAADWTRVRPDLPPRLPLCPEGTGPARQPRRPGAGRPPAGGRPGQPPEQVGDRWLRMEYGGLLLAFAQRLRLDAAARRSLTEALRDARFGTVPLPTTVRALIDGHGPQPLIRKLDRTEACSLVTAHLEPLLNPAEFVRFLERLALNNVFFRAAVSAGAVPLSVAAREQARDRDLVDRWAGAPPVKAQLAPKASRAARAAAEQDYRLKLEAYNARRRAAGAFVGSEPNALPLAVPADVSAAQARTLRALNQAGRAGLLPVLVVGGRQAPANLYVSEAAPLVAEYLAPLRSVLVAAGGGLGLASGLTAVAYGVLALATVPVTCLYDTFHGTCAIENVVPRLLASSDAMTEFARGPLRRILADLRRRRGQVEDADTTPLLDAFAAFVEAIAAGIRGSLARLLTVAADQGARVRTPVQFTRNRQWEFAIPEVAADGSTTTVRRTAAEALSYVGNARDDDSEIFWLLPGLWPALGTGVALANQSGVRVWVNAANNRWGGNHPPHRVHRQGCSLDIDAGLVWRGDKVRNVVKRDYVGHPLPESEMAGNRDNADCLRFTERLVGWILTQSFVIIGVTQYLYGDAGLVEQAYAHLRARFQVIRPARMDGVIDAKGHNDHWHFELLVGQRPAGADPYVWAVPDGDLLGKLRELAVMRDADEEFWYRFAGLEKVPTDPKDFDSLPDADDWRRWWNRKNEPCGIPLLPVWAPEQARRTNLATQCWQPAGDFPDAFQPGGDATA